MLTCKCGETFEPTHHKQRRCPTCRQKMYKLSERPKGCPSCAELHSALDAANKRADYWESVGKSEESKRMDCQEREALRAELREIAVLVANSPCTWCAKVRHKIEGIPGLEVK